MDYNIAAVVPGKFKVNKDNLKKVNPNQFQQALAVASEMEWKNDSKTLIIVTTSFVDAISKNANVKNYAEASTTAIRLAEFNSATFFTFKNLKLITTWATEESIKLVEFLWHISQAHSFGVLNIRMEENKIPFGGIEISNLTRNRPYIVEFLDDLQGNNFFQ